MTDTDTKKPTPKDDDSEQTWIAHVENGKVVARIKSEDYPAYAKKNGL